ncbi:sugar kinase, ribokinase [Frankia torreyi]|uniref:Sugar kinase, ribokinase n=1 Tax=Frankia torreyi TaxID=1856 RepID=A0A0D8BCI2_9ACTN|nr:sugar kinase, ribokinase [Frankia torreyi]KQM03758.1 sugar kinase, ribokinase [Frankia sp. CpI1-P]
MVVVGGFCLDCIVTTDTLPAWGDDLRVDAVRTRPGGKGLNQAVALARRGVPVRAVGVVGGDTTGRELLAALRAEGVDPAMMAVRPAAATPVCVVLAHPDGRTAFLCRWAEAVELTPGDLAPAREAIRSARAVIVTFDPPPATVRAAVDHALAAGTALVVHPAPPERSAAAALVDLPWDRVSAVTPNEQEARLLLAAAGDPAATGPGAELAAAFGRRFATPLVCVTRAEHGVAVWDGTRGWARPAHPTTVVDTTAASDAFTAALTHVLFAGDAADTDARSTDTDAADTDAADTDAADTDAADTDADATQPRAPASATRPPGLVEAAVEAGLAAAAWTVRHRGALDALPRLAGPPGRAPAGPLP